MDHLAEDLPATAPTSWRRSRTCAAPARAGRSRSCRRPSKTSQTDLGTSATPKGTSRAPVVVTSPQADGLLGLRVARPARRPAGHGRPRRRDGHLHAARAPRSARSADRALRARPAGDHDEGVRRGGNPCQPAAVDAVAGQSALRHRRRRRALLLRRAVRAGLGGARRGAPIHPVRRARARRRRADPGQPCGAPGLDRSARGGRLCSSCSNCSRISCSRRCCTPARPAFRRWRCWYPWRSGPGSGGRSAC